MTTINELVGITDLSTTNISTAINNDFIISQRNQVKFKATMDLPKINPDLAVRSLTNGNTHVLGLVIPTALSSLFTDPFFSILSQGISEICAAKDYTLMLWLVKPRPENRLKNDLLNTHLVNGVIIASNTIGDPLIEMFVSRNIPLAVVGQSNNPKANTVDVDNIHSVMTAVQHLLDVGRKRLATITGDIQLCSGYDRLIGFKRGLAANNLPILQETIAYGDFTEQSGYQQAKNLLERTEFDGLFVASDAMAIGAIRAIREAGLTVPEDIALVSFDNIPTASQHRPSLTTIRQPIYQLGSSAAQLVIDQVESNGTLSPQHLVLPTELIIRETSRRVVLNN